jgi:hypothetical protein
VGSEKFKIEVTSLDNLYKRFVKEFNMSNVFFTVINDKLSKDNKKGKNKLYIILALLEIVKVMKGSKAFTVDEMRAYKFDSKDPQFSKDFEKLCEFGGTGKQGSFTAVGGGSQTHRGSVGSNSEYQPTSSSQTHRGSVKSGKGGNSGGVAGGKKKKK